MHNLEKLQGFFLMMKSGRIDLAIDKQNIRNTIMDTLAFDDAVKASFDFAAKNNGTLVMVTSDHAKGGLEIMPGPRYYFDSDPQETAHTASDVPIMARNKFLKVDWTIQTSFALRKMP